MGLNKKQIDNIMNILQEAEKNKTKLPSLTMQPTDSSKKLSDVTKNLQSTATRLQSVGVDTNALTDTRNPLEKALNLTEDQNFLFDILETINRPQQAIFGAITAAQTSGDVGKDFMAGLTGEKETFGGDIIRNITGGQKTEGVEAFTDWQNWAGFALDVMLDPADLGLAIITGGGSLAVQGGAELVDTAGDVARTGAKTLDKLGGLQDVLLGKGNRLVIPKSPGEYVKMLADKNYRAVNALDKASLTSMTFKSLGAGFKTGTALADSILESTMSKLDTQGQTLSAYRALKKGISQSVDDMGAYVKRARSAGNERYNTTMESLAPVFNSLTDKIKKVALETGLSEEEVAIRTMRAYEGWFLRNRNLDPDSFLDFITKTPYKFLPDEEKTLESIRKIFGDDAVGAIERVTLDGMPVLRFDETFWNKANLENISKFRDDAPAKTLFSKGDREAYEDALRRTNPEKLDEYDAKRMAYERELAGRVTKQYEQTYPEDYTRKTIAERKKAKAKIRRQIEKADLASGRHPQNLLDEALPTGTGGLVYRTAKERLYDFNRLSQSDQAIAKNMRGEIRQRVNTAVEKNFPASREPIELSAKKEYIANRKKFAQNVRKEFMKEYDDFLINRAPKGTEVVQEVAEDVAEDVAGVRANPELRDIIRKSPYGATELAQDRNLTGWVVSHPEIDPYDVIENMEDIWYETRLIDGQKALKPISEDDALEMVIDKLGRNVYDGWFRSADSGYKPIIVQAILSDPEVYNASMNIMWKNYKEVYGDIPFDEFLNTEITLYRGGTKKAVDKDIFTAYSLNEKIAKKFAGQSGEVATIKVKPKDTFGMLNDIGEMEVLVPTKPLSRLDLPWNAKKAIPQTAPIGKQVSESTETVAKNAPEATPNTYPRDAKVELGTFYTEEQLEQLAKDFETPWIKDMIDYYDGVITKTQRIIGEMEFGDAEALVRDSMKGYTTHAPSADVSEVFKNIKEKYKLKDLDYSYFAPGRTQALKGRQYFGSALEANTFRTHYFTELLKNDEWVKTQLTDIDDEALEAMEEYFKMDLFSEDARTSLGTMMTKVYSSINHNHKTTEMAIAMSFGKAGNENSAFKVIKKGVGQPDGYRVLANDEIQKLRSTIRETKRFAGGGMFIDALAKQLDEGLADANQAVMDSHLYNMWKTMGNKDAKNAFAMMDMFNQAFKVGKTLSPSFNVKNLFSNMSNFWLSGADAPDVFRYWNKSVDASKKMVAINDKVVKGGLEALTEEEAKLYQIYKEFLDNGFMSKQTLYRLNDLDTPGQFQFKANKITKGEFDTLTNNPLTRANMEMNLWIDNRMRLGLYMYAKEHPEYLRRLGFDPERTDSAMKAVRMVLFDPNDLTFFEDDIMKRLVPFYTFTRQNLAFQMKNLALNSERYYKVYKAYNGWNKEFMNLDKEDLQKYQVDQLYVPVFSKKDGSYVTLKTGIAMTALSELTLDPIDMTQNVVSKLTPLIKAPFEKATGIQTFTGRPIEDYKGQPSTNIPGMSKGTEWLLSQVGADVPLRGAAGVVSAVSNLAQGKGGEAVDSLLQKSANLTTSIDPVANEVNTKYRKLDILNEKLKSLKAGGTTIPTITEIQAKALDDTQQGRIAEMQAITDMIRNIKR